MRIMDGTHNVVLKCLEENPVCHLPFLNNYPESSTNKLLEASEWAVDCLCTLGVGNRSQMIKNRVGNCTGCLASTSPFSSI